MQGPAPGIPIESLVAHREWVRRVARALVRDESLADDLEQEVWVEALERPPRTTSALGGWLAAAMRHNLADRRRSEGSRRAREESVARPEREKSAAELVAEAEMFKRLVAAVLDLDEPGRETILLRYFEDLPLKEVARRQGVPLETVRTRIRSGIATLKRRFDAESGSRGAWSVALAPIVGEFARVRGSTPSPPPLATTAGALIMGTKVKLAAGAVCVALFGFAAWQVVAPGPIETTGGEARIARRDSSLPRREAARAEADGPESSPKPVAGEPSTPARTPPENPVVQVYGVVRSPDGLPVSGAKVLREVERSEPVEVAVDQDAGADRRAFVDMRAQTGMRRELAGVVVVEVVHLRTGGEQPQQPVAVLFERDVQRRHGIAGAGVDPLEQPDIALDAGDERRIARRCKAQLLQGAQAVGVAVEGKVACHGNWSVIRA